MFYSLKKIKIAVCLSGLFLSACQYEKLQPYGVGCDSEISYKNEIAPIVNTYCIGCHYTGSGTADFTSWAGLKTAADNGSIRNRVIVLKDMPQGTALSEEQLKKINCWLKQGALNN